MTNTRANIRSTQIATAISVTNVSVSTGYFEAMRAANDKIIEQQATIEALTARLEKLDGYMAGALDCRMSSIGWQDLVRGWREEINATLSQHQGGE